MLSREEKREMLEDAHSEERRQSFRMGRPGGGDRISFDDYMSFLESVQKIFAPFKISTTPTITKLNKL